MDDDNSIYVGGLSFDTTEDALRDKFKEFGYIVAVKILTDRDTGNSRGYGFVTFTTARAATKAISNMDGGSIGGRPIKVNEAKPKNGFRLGRDNGRFGFRDQGRGRDHRDFRYRDRNGNAREFSPPRNRRSSPGAHHLDRGRLLGHRRSHSPQGGQSRSRSASPKRVRRDDHSSGSPSPNRFESMDTLTRKDMNYKKEAKGREEDLPKIRDELERANLRRDELRRRLGSLEEENASKEQQIAELRSKSQKLEEALSMAVSATTQKHSQLMKLQRAFLEVRTCKENLRCSEQELQGLMECAAPDVNLVGGLELHEKRRGSKTGLGLPEEDMEWKDDDCQINIDD